MLNKYPSLDLADVQGIIITKRNTQYILLMDDRDACEVAEKEGIEYYDLPSFLEYCILQGEISKTDLEEIFDLLKKRDFYEFKYEVKLYLQNLFTE